MKKIIIEHSNCVYILLSDQLIMPVKPNSTKQEQRQKVLSNEELCYIVEMLKPLTSLEENKMCIHQKSMKCMAIRVQTHPTKSYLFGKIFTLNRGFTTSKLKANRNYIFNMTSGGTWEYRLCERKPFKGLVLNAWRSEILPSLFYSLNQSSIHFGGPNIFLNNVEII